MKRAQLKLLERLILLVSIACYMSCDSTSEQDEEHHHDDVEEGSHHEHGVGESGAEAQNHEEQAYERSGLARLSSRQCEHDIPILDCDACRYEVGAVEVSASLLDPDLDNLVTTAKLQSRLVRQTLRLTGEVSFDDRRVAHVSPRVDGIVRRAYVALGDQVERGAKLVVMDSLELGLLRSRYLQAASRHELAQKNFEREERLHERRIASGREKLQAETAFREARIRLESAREQLRLLGVSGRGLDQVSAGGTSSRAGGAVTLTSPITGTIVAMHAVNGERVSPEESVITIANLSKVWVWADVYERDLGSLITASSQSETNTISRQAEGSESIDSAHLKAVVEVKAFNDRSFVGELNYVGAVMEEATRTVKVRVEVDNTQKLLRPGMFADVTVELAEGEEALSIPAEAVMQQEDQSFLFVEIGPQRFMRRDVVTQSLGEGNVELVDGVGEGEVVVVQGAFLLKSDILREQMGAGCAH